MRPYFVGTIGSWKRFYALSPATCPEWWAGSIYFWDVKRRSRQLIFSSCWVKRCSSQGLQKFCKSRPYHCALRWRMLFLAVFNDKVTDWDISNYRCAFSAVTRLLELPRLGCYFIVLFLSDVMTIHFFFLVSSQFSQRVDLFSSLCTFRRLCSFFCRILAPCADVFCWFRCPFRIGVFSA